MSDKKLVAIVLVASLLFVVVLTAIRLRNSASTDKRNNFTARTWHEHTFDGLGFVQDIESAPGGTTFATFDHFGICRTTDGGLTWKNVTNGLKPASLCIGFGTGRTVFVGGGRGIYRSADNGDHWEPLDKGLESAAVEKIAHDMDGNVVASWCRTDEKYHVSRLDEEGRCWQQVRTPWANKRVVRIFPPIGRRQYVVTSQGVYLATGGWSKWKHVLQLPKDDYIRSSAISKEGRVAFVVTEYGDQDGHRMDYVFESSADGMKWSEEKFSAKSGTFGMHNINPHCVGWTSDGKLLAGANSGLYERAPDNRSWNLTNARTMLLLLTAIPPWVSAISTDRVGRIYLASLDHILVSDPETVKKEH
jgi:hypothetical protein